MIEFFLRLFWPGILKIFLSISYNKTSKRDVEYYCILNFDFTSFFINYLLVAVLRKGMKEVDGMKKWSKMNQGTSTFEEILQNLRNNNANEVMTFVAKYLQLLSKSRPKKLRMNERKELKIGD